MSQSIYLVCHETKQEVHVSSTSGGSWFRGPDSSLVVAAFCDAHAFDRQLVVLGEEWDYHVDRAEYVEWTVENVHTQFALIAGSRGNPTLPLLLEAMSK